MFSIERSVKKQSLFVTCVGRRRLKDVSLPDEQMRKMSYPQKFGIFVGVIGAVGLGIIASGKAHDGSMLMTQGALPKTNSFSLTQAADASRPLLPLAEGTSGEPIPFTLPWTTILGLQAANAAATLTQDEEIVRAPSLGSVQADAVSSKPAPVHQGAPQGTSEEHTPPVADEEKREEKERHAVKEKESKEDKEHKEDDEEKKEKKEQKDDEGNEQAQTDQLEIPVIVIPLPEPGAESPVSMTDIPALPGIGL